MMIRRNPYRNATPPGWNPMGTAPSDGTVIEIQNNWGVAASFGIYRYDDGRWVDANDARSGVIDGGHLSWRPYAGDERDYSDPTGGAQTTSAYWIAAAGLDPSDYPDADTRWDTGERVPHPALHKRPDVDDYLPLVVVGLGGVLTAIAIFMVNAL